MGEEVWGTQEPVPVNDGGGLYDSVGLIDTLLVDCNELPSTLFNGKYVRFCALLVEMVRKLAQLKEGVKNDLNARNKRIDELTQALQQIRGEE